MNGLIYLLQVNLYLLLFYLFYLVLLRNETFFKLNRVYLVSSAIVSLLIPILRSDWVRELFVTEKVYSVTQSVGSAIIVYSAPVTTKPEGVSTQQLIWIIYAIGAGAAFLHFLWKLYRVSKSLRSNPEKQAFSFFKKVAVDENLPEKELIIKHELVHVKQWHSADVIFFELLTIVNWFNPIAYLYKKAVKNIHEFIADETAANPDKASYAMLLLTTTFGVQPHQLTNSFFNQSILKRRIFMLHKTKSRKAAILKYGLSAPLFAGMVILSSATVDKSNETSRKQVLGFPTPPLTSQALPADTGAIYTVGSPLDVNPEFPGGMAKFYQFVAKNYEYPKEAQEKGVSGKIFLSFVVEKDGSLKEKKVVRDAGFGTGNQALKMLEKCPKWEPGKIKGKAVRVAYTLHIALQLDIKNGKKVDSYLLYSDKDSF